MPAPRKTDNSPDLPLTMEFDDGDLMMVRGVSLTRMSSHRLIALAKELAKLNLAQEQEIGRYKAEVEDLYAQADREHSSRLAAEVVERRDLFAMAALIGLLANDKLSTSSFAQDAKNAFDGALAMEAERSARASS